MALVKPTIFQIVGFQNSGKTTFVKKILQELSNEELTTVTIKHHGHGGKPNTTEEKDSVQHLKAGAVASIVEGDGRLILQAEKKKWSIDEKIRLLSFFNPDIILIEGHKFDSYMKAVLLRGQEDLHLLEKLENIQVIYYWDDFYVKSNNQIPCFHINDWNGYKWLVQFLKNKYKETNN